MIGEGRSMIRKALLICLTFFSLNLFSNDWEDIIPNLTDDDFHEFEKDGYTDRNRSDYKSGLELFPIGNDFEEDFYKDLIYYNPELVTEMLYVIDKPSGLSSVDLLNNLRAFSEQKGLEYWSHNRGKMYPLIKDSYYLTEEKGKKTLDPVVTKLPEYEEHYYYQKDSSFGSNYYKLTTRTKGNTIWLQMTNLKDLKVMGLFKALDAEEQRTNFLLYEYQDKVIIYCQAQILKEPKIKKVLTYNVNIPGSFKRRMDTIIKWFIERIEK